MGLLFQRAGEDILIDATTVSPVLLVAGYVILLVYVSIYTRSWGLPPTQRHAVASHTLIGILGVLIIALATGTLSLL
jgi:hypothetical protein